jgi:hypothetical protein
MKTRWCDGCGKMVETDETGGTFFCSEECKIKWHSLWSRILEGGE